MSRCKESTSRLAKSMLCCCWEMGHAQMESAITVMHWCSIPLATNCVLAIPRSLLNTIETLKMHTHVMFIKTSPFHMLQWMLLCTSYLIIRAKDLGAHQLIWLASLRGRAAEIRSWFNGCFLCSHSPEYWYQGTNPGTSQRCLDTGWPFHACF